MNLSQDINRFTSRVDRWSDKHHPYVLEYIRIAFGIVVMIMAFSFTLKKDLIDGIVANANWPYLTRGMIQAVNFGQVVLGIMIALGLFTRVTSMLLIPLLIATIALLSTLAGFLPIYSQISMYLFFLVASMFFMVYGAGHYSIDHFRKTSSSENTN